MKNTERGIFVSKKEKKTPEKETKAVEVNEAAENAETAESAAEDKSENKNALFKTAIVRSVAAAVCTAIICVSVSSGAGKYAEAIEKSAEFVPAASYSQGTSGSAADSGSAETDSTDYGVPSEAPTDDATAIEDTAADGSSAETPSGDTASADTAQNGSKPAADASKMDKAQIVALFNSAANGAKTSAKSIKQNYTKNTQVTGIELKNKMLASLADSLIKANMGEDKTKHDKTYTGGDKAAYFPVSGQQWASKLTAADVKEATIKESNGVYDVTIKLVDDTQDNLKAGEGHAGKAISLVTKEQIVDGAGSAGMAVIKEESIKVRHSGCVIKAKIDKNTGKLKTANYYRVWRLALTALGIDVAISFGIEEDFVINW